MDHAVALVEACLKINGYFTVAEYPVIESFGKQHYGVATDLDILAFRFPGAGRLVPGHGGSGLFPPDPALGIDSGKVLRHAQFKHPALGLFMVLETARREVNKGEISCPGCPGGTAAENLQ